MKKKLWLMAVLILVSCSETKDPPTLAPIKPQGPTSEEVLDTRSLAADCVLKDGSAPNSDRIRPEAQKEASGKNVDIDWILEVDQVTVAVDICKQAVVAGAPLQDHLTLAESDLTNAYLEILKQPDLDANYCWDDPECLLTGRDGAAKRLQIYLIRNAKPITPKIGRAIRAAYKLGTYEKLLLWESDKENYAAIRESLCDLIEVQKTSAQTQIFENPPRLEHGLKDRKKKPRGSRLQCDELKKEQEKTAEITP